LLTGAVLAGGQSRRYGKNKAFEVFEGKRLVDRAVEAARAFCDPVLLVANDLSLYIDVNATLVQDFAPFQGPLVGLYTALLFSPNDWVFVRATDMPVLVPDLLSMMLDMRGSFDVVVPMSGNDFEPLMALYHKRCIPAIANMIDRSEKRVMSFYKSVRVRTISEKRWRAVDPAGVSFANVNTPEDWNKIVWNSKQP
jgi:molybdopterin-guanine dinucleotide biosynthesis protein A